MFSRCVWKSSLIECWINVFEEGGPYLQLSFYQSSRHKARQYGISTAKMPSSYRIQKRRNFWWWSSQSESEDYYPKSSFTPIQAHSKGSRLSVEGMKKNNVQRTNSCSSHFIRKGKERKNTKSRKRSLPYQECESRTIRRKSAEEVIKISLI